jgi:hypothetical protein
MMAATEAKNKVTLDAIKKKGTAHYLFGTLKIMPEKSKENTIHGWTNRLFQTITDCTLIKSKQVEQGMKGRINMQVN